MNFKWFWRVATPTGGLVWVFNLVHHARRDNLDWMVVDSACICLAAFLTWLAWSKPEKMTDVE